MYYSSGYASWVIGGGDGFDPDFVAGNSNNSTPPLYGWSTFQNDEATNLTLIAGNCPYCVSVGFDGPVYLNGNYFYYGIGDLGYPIFSKNDTEITFYIAYVSSIGSWIISENPFDTIPVYEYFAGDSSNSTPPQSWSNIDNTAGLTVNKDGCPATILTTTPIPTTTTTKRPKTTTTTTKRPKTTTTTTTTTPVPLQVFSCQTKICTSRSSLTCENKKTKSCSCFKSKLTFSNIGGLRGAYLPSITLCYRKTNY
jgi:hypothetical protein